MGLVEMLNAGWRDAFKNTNAWEATHVTRNIPSASFWGWLGGSPSLELRLPLRGSGKVFVNFDNAWSRGSVDVFLNDVKKCSAGPNIFSKMVSMPFQDGDVLKIGEYGTTILVLNSITMSCAHSSGDTGCGPSPVTQPATKIAGSMNLQGGDGLEKSVVETASQQALSTHFNIPAEQVSTTAKQSRRLDTAPRRLAGKWVVDYELLIYAIQASVIQERYADTQTNSTLLMSALKSRLSDAGASPAGAASIIGMSISSPVVNATTTTNTPPPTTSNPAAKPLELSSAPLALPWFGFFLCAGALLHMV